MDADRISQLIAAAKGGDSAARDEVFATIRNHLESHAARVVGARLEALVRRSDLVQSTWLAVLKDFQSFDGTREAELGAWVRTLFERQISRKLRFFSAKRRDIGRQVELQEADFRSDRTPSVELGESEEVATVIRALEFLPEPQRQIVVWRSIEGRDYEEIAATTGNTVPTLRTLFWRARAALAVVVKRLESGEKSPGDGERPRTSG